MKSDGRGDSLVLGLRRAGTGKNQVPWPGTSLPLAPPCRNRLPSTKPPPSPTWGRSLVRHSLARSPGTHPFPPVTSPFKSSHCSLLRTSSHPCPPRDAFLAALAMSPATSSRHPRSSKTLHPSGDPHLPPGTPASVGASRGREHGIQRGALRAPMLRSQGYHVMLMGCYGNGGFSQKKKRQK